MAIKVLSPGPDKSVLKEIVCKKCGAVLEYAPVDVQLHVWTDYGGDSNHYYYILCPQCNHKNRVPAPGV